MPALSHPPWFELARFRRSRLTRVAILAVTVVPLLYGALYIWANLNPTGNLDQVDAAIVNDDQLIEVAGPDGEKQPIAIGRQLAGNLISDDSKQNYDWHLTDGADAAEGLADGRYKAVLHIPENLSSAATSTSGDPSRAVQGRLDLQTNDAVNYVNGAIAERILDAAQETLNAQVTETYLDNVYLGFSDIRVALGDAADGAGELGAGASELADGANQLSRRRGRAVLWYAAAADGAGALDDGVQQLDGGLSTLDRQTAGLPDATSRLAGGARQVSDGTAQLNTTVQQVTGAILDATDNANADIDALAAELNRLADACEASETPGVDCSALREAADQSEALKDAVGSSRGELERVRTDSQRLADGADQVADGNEELAASTPALVDAISQAADGAGRLADGTSALASGSEEAAAGAARLAGGLGEAATGADALAEGAYQLQAGLNDGRKDVPDYTEDERAQLAKTAATPVEDAAERANSVDGYGAALAPYFMALALWVGAMAIYLLLRPLSRRAIASTAGSIRTAMAGFAPGAALAGVQAILLVAVVEGLLGVNVDRPLLLLGTALAAGITFVALNQMFIALLGPAGRFVAIVFVCLQLTSAGGTYPIETSPGFFGALHHLLPMTYVVELFRGAFAGGGHAIVGNFAVLGLFTVAALAITSLAAYRQQNVKMSQLHPTLVV